MTSVPQPHSQVLGSMLDCRSDTVFLETTVLPWLASARTPNQPFYCIVSPQLPLANLPDFT
jgi:hypothetical protein